MEMVVESSNQTLNSNVGQDCCLEKTQLPMGYGLTWLTCQLKESVEWNYLYQ